jgi:hypothetical protein
MKNKVVSQINNLSEEGVATLLNVANLFIDETKDIALSGNVKDEKTQEEIIARQIFNEWFNSLLDECKEEKEKNKEK